jgi:6-phosphogluconolactonase
LDAELGLVYVPSKGTDAVFIGDFNAITGEVSERARLTTRLGSGPRHLIMAPDQAQLYLANENDCCLTIVERNVPARRLTVLEHISALPHPSTPQDSGADVHVSRDGRFIYMSVRGHDIIAVFARRGEQVECVQHVATHGRTPRNFCLLGDDLLIVANQESTNVALFYRDQATGQLTFWSEVDTVEHPYWVGNPESY